MCNKIVTDQVGRGIGVYQKGNQPEEIRMEVLVAPCQCGERIWARVKDGVVWVEAEKEETNVDESAAQELARDIARIGPAAA